MKKLITIALTIIFITFSACEKKFNPAAPEHEPGRIVTCKIDGKEWSHGDHNCAQCHSLRMDYYSGDKRLDFDAKNFLEDPFHNGLSMYIYIDSVGQFNFINSLPVLIEFNLPIGCTYAEYYPDSLYNNQFNVEKFDPVNHIIEGSFDFRAINYHCQDTIMVTNGYYNLKPIWHK